MSHPAYSTCRTITVAIPAVKSLIRTLQFFVFRFKYLSNTVLMWLNTMNTKIAVKIQALEYKITGDDNVNIVPITFGNTLFFSLPFNLPMNIMFAGIYTIIRITAQPNIKYSLFAIGKNITCDEI